MGAAPADPRSTTDSFWIAARNAVAYSGPCPSGSLWFSAARYEPRLPGLRAPVLDGT